MSLAKRIGFLDKNVKISTLQRLFIAANFEEVQGQDDNPDKALIRFEFIELLIRIAKEKYQKTGEFPDIGDAFEHLLEKHI